MAFLYENVTEEERVIFLASILHDIGKFYQACGGKEVKADIIKKYKTHNESDGKNSPGHQEWGAYFCEKYVKDPEISKIIFDHHHPESILELIVAVGDKLSGEAQDLGKEEDLSQLVSVLSKIKLDDLGVKKEFYKKIKPLSEMCFSSDQLEENVSLMYGALWSSFLQDFKKIKNFYDPVELTKLYYILEEYTFNIPSEYYPKSDISLWEHLKSTAAIAFSLYRQVKDLPEHQVKQICEDILKDEHKDSKPLFCLVKGDISGIQDFVYDVAVDGATKALRGRSFYISYLLWVVARYILRKEKLPITNILYGGGGHFYLLLPGSFLERIEEYQEKLDNLLFDAHDGKLCILLSGVSVSGKELSNKDFSQKFNEVGSKISQKKNRKYFSLFKKDQDAIFGPFDDDLPPCPHCGRPLKTGEDVYCTFCSSFEKLGEEIIKKKYILERWGDASEGNTDSIKDIFSRLGLKFTFSEKPTQGFCYTMANVVLDFGHCCGSLKIPVGMKTNEEGNIASFDEISSCSRGIKVWGVIRGDVDNLGRIFREGLGEAGSIARVATLSQELSQFFGPYLEKMVEQEFKDCVVIYAGGDDFFFVGPWDRLPYLGYAVRQRFIEFTGNNPALTVSMAFSMAPDKKFPLYRVAATAGEELDNAKGYIRMFNGKQKEKDAFSFSSYVIGWEEFNKLSSFKEKLVEALEDKKVSRSLLDIIYRSEKEKNLSIEQNELFRAWRLVYYITRLKERNKRAEGLIDELKSIVLEQGNKLYKYSYLAARWAEFETRK
jgi:CRISPR-associated protein Csm1